MNFPSPYSSNYSILILDDDEANLRRLHEFLSKAEYRVTMARSFNDAEVLLSTSRFDAILAYEHVERRSGCSFLATARAVHPGAARILIGDDKPFHCLVEIVEQVGLSAFLLRSHDDRDLLHAIQRALSHHPEIYSNVTMQSVQSRLR